MLVDVLALLLSAALVGAPEEGVVILAEAGGGAEQSRAQEVMRAFVGVEADVEETRLPGDLGSLAERARWAAELAHERDALGVFWVELGDANDLLLYLAVPSGDRVLVRTIPKDRENPAATWDALGVITGSISSALVSGAEVGMVEVELPEVSEPEPDLAPVPDPDPPPVREQEPTPEPEPAPEPKPTWQRLTVSFAYVGASLASRAPWTHRVGVGLDWRIRPVPYVGVHYGWGVPIRVSDSDVAFVVSRHVVEARVGARLPAGRRLSIDLEGFGATDVQSSRSPRTAQGIEQLSGVRSVAAVGSRSRVRVRVAPQVEVFGSFGVEAALNRFNYVVFSPNGADVRLAPHLVRGEVAIGAAFGFLDR